MKAKGCAPVALCFAKMTLEEFTGETRGREAGGRLLEMNTVT